MNKHAIKTEAKNLIFFMITSILYIFRLSSRGRVSFVQKVNKSKFFGTIRIKAYKRKYEAIYPAFLFFSSVKSFSFENMFCIIFYYDFCD